MTTWPPATGTFGVRQAAFIGVGAMVGAGIFALLGAAGEVAGAAVWLSFLLAGAVAGLQGYSFAKFGSRYPSAGGLLEYAWILVLAVASTVIVLVAFVFTTLVDEPGTAVALVVVLLISVALDAGWKRSRARVVAT